MADEENDEQHDEQAEAPATESEAARKVGVRFAEEDRWEVWAYISIGLAVTTVVALIVTFMKLGVYSVWAYQDMLLYCGWGTVLLSFWGLIRTFFNPPVLRRSRTIAFAILLLVGYLTLSRPFGPQLSTEEWTTEAEVRLPFDGEWMTLAGGPDRETNFYANLPSMRWAYAFGPVENGKTFQGDGERVEDYNCWGKEVLSPVDGEVVSFENSIADVGMEASPTGNVLGNHVGIKIGEDEFVFLSSMMEKSVTVRPGDEVAIGDVLGKCGRSGYTPEPIVVMHGQNSLRFPVTEGLPIRFTAYESGGKVQKNRMPHGTSVWDGRINGDRVSNVSE